MGFTHRDQHDKTHWRCDFDDAHDDVREGRFLSSTRLSLDENMSEGEHLGDLPLNGESYSILCRSD
jgi:hypothetical protein